MNFRRTWRKYKRLMSGVFLSLTTVSMFVTVLKYSSNRSSNVEHQDNSNNELLKKDAGTAESLEMLLDIPPIEFTPLILHESQILFCPLLRNLYLPVVGLLCSKNLRPGAFKRQMDESVAIQEIAVNCINDLRKKKWNSETIWAADSGWTRMVILRHPFERVLASWSSLCLSGSWKRKDNCYGCKDDLACFLKRHYEHVQIMLTRKRIFTHFPLDMAFYPQVWSCDLWRYANNYTVTLKFTKSQSFIKEVRNVFLDRGWRRWTVDKFLKLEKDTSVSDALFQLSQRKFDALLDKNLEFANLLFSAQFADFFYLGFEIPASIRQRCIQSSRTLDVCLWKNYEGGG